MNEFNPDSSFGKFYMFMTEAKITACLFFTYTIFMYTLLVWLSGSTTQSVNIVMTLQMLAVCLIIGLSQRLIIPRGGVTLAKSILWGAVSVVATIIGALAFGWFKGFPVWCLLVYWGVLFVGLFFMALHLQITLAAETKELNEQLKKFQKKGLAKKGELE